MSGLPKSNPGVSPAEYLERERRAEFKSEYHDGVVVAMSGASRLHNRIVTNLIARLDEQLRAGPCNVYGGDFRVSIDSGRRYVYPDIVVTCGTEELDAGDTLKNPIVIVEVLSASTEYYDRSVKLHAYQKIPSLREYVIVSTETRLVEVFRRVDDGTWSDVSSSLLNAPIELKSIGCGLPLDEVYFKTEVPDSSGGDREWSGKRGTSASAGFVPWAGSRPGSVMF